MIWIHTLKSDQTAQNSWNRSPWRASNAKRHKPHYSVDSKPSSKPWLRYCAGSSLDAKIKIGQLDRALSWELISAEALNNTGGSVRHGVQHSICACPRQLDHLAPPTIFFFLRRRKTLKFSTRKTICNFAQFLFPPGTGTARPWPTITEFSECRLRSFKLDGRSGTVRYDYVFSVSVWTRATVTASYVAGPGDVHPRDALYTLPCVF